MSNVVRFRKEPDPIDHRLMSASDFEFVEPEPEDDIVPGLIPKRDVTLLAGRAGNGKTFLAQMLATAAAVERDWIGQHVRQCRSFCLFSEDRKEKLTVRQQKLCRYYGVSFSDLARAMLVPNDDDNFTLFSCFRKSGGGAPRTLWNQFEEICGGDEIELIILDNVQNIFEGDPNNDLHVNSFLRWFNFRARILNAAIVIISNPPKDRTSYFRGSQKWEDSCRHTLSLNAAKDENGQDDPDSLVLKVEKSNYLPFNHPFKRRGITLEWQNDVLVNRVVNEPAALDHLGRLDLETRIVTAVRHAVDVLGHKFAADTQSQNYLPGRLAAQKQWQHIAWSELAGAVDRLLSDGRLIKVSVKDSWMIRAPDGQPYLGER